jgi:hypothetical protein
MGKALSTHGRDEKYIKIISYKSSREERGYLGGLGVGMKIILKWVLKE